MSYYQHVNLVSQPPVPWTHGETTTVAIYPPRAVYPPGYPGERFDCRITTATVNSDGQFRDFTGYDRIFMILSGNGIILNPGEPDEAVIDRPLVTHTLRGERKPKYRLINGPVVDFNVFTDRSRVRAEAKVFELLREGRVSRDAQFKLTADKHFFYCVNGPTSPPIFLSACSGTTGLQPGQALRYDGCPPASSESDALEGSILSSGADAVVVGVSLVFLPQSPRPGAG